MLNNMLHLNDLKTWEDAKNQILCCDCLEYMKLMPDNCVDLVLTDPPYGVNFSYESYNDTPENLKKLVDSFMPELLRISNVVLITCGNSNQWLYPKPDHILAWVITAGAGMNNWGFSCWQPILAYGKDPYLANKLGSRPDIIMSNETSVKFGHSCTKPINVWKKLLSRGSVKETDIIFDPFMGSWTTARACKDLGRNFICCELDEKYCAIGEQRLRQEVLI